MTEPNGEAERLGALVAAKLAELETRAAEGELPSLAELNAVRRLVLWLETERHAAEARRVMTR